MRERIVGSNGFTKYETGIEIVRCRDCKHHRDGIIDGRHYTEPYCGAIGELAFGALFEVGDEDFCSWAERGEQ